MATQKLNLTRDQLATFLKNHEQIKQFEQLFAVADQVASAPDTQGIGIQAGNAEASANSALAQLIVLANDAAINSGNADSKAQQALDALNRIANSLGLLATAPVVQNNNSLVTDYIDVRYNAPVAVGGIPGRLKWNDTEGTLDLGLKGGNVTLQIGQENVLFVKNDDTVPLTDGMMVYISGANGANLLVKRALADSDLTSASTIGMVTEPLAVNGQGFITVFGTVRGLNTNAFNEGDVLYLSPTTPGAITNVKPVAPQHLVAIGYVEKKSGGNGEVFVKVDNGYELDELHNVKITNPVANKSLLQYNSALGVWENVTASSATIGTATNLAGGAAGSVPYQTAADTTAFRAIGTAGQVFRVNSGATAPEWVSPAALTKVDDTNVTLTLGGNPTTALLAAASLTLGWTGQLSVARGGSGASTAAGARTNFGATTVGSNLFTLTNPSAVAYMRINADNSVSTLDATAFRTAIGAGTGNGTVTSVSTGTGLTGGPITGSGTISFSVAAVGTWAATPSSANLAAAMTDETGSGSLVFATQPSFASTIGVGGAAASASGAGITFPATQSSSSNANTLDDYEEGTWTPTVTAGSISGSNLAYTGTYTKIGRVVTITFKATSTSSSNNVVVATYVAFAGLPFSASEVGTGFTSTEDIDFKRGGEVNVGGTVLYLGACGANPGTNSIFLTMSYITST